MRSSSKISTYTILIAIVLIVFAVSIFLPARNRNNFLSAQNQIKNTATVGDGTANNPYEISSCTSISVPGNYVLIQDLFDLSLSACITINATNVIFDGQGHTLTGVGDNPTNTGIRINANAIVKNVIVTAFRNGIYITGNDASLLNSTTTNDNFSGIYVPGYTNVTILNNYVNNTGSYGIYDAGMNSLISNNVVDKIKIDSGPQNVSSINNSCPATMCYQSGVYNICTPNISGYGNCNKTINPPVVNTNTNLIPSVTKTTASLSGNLTSVGSGSMQEIGFYYNEYALFPTVQKIAKTSGITTGNYTLNLSDLKCGGWYAFQAYAKNLDGEVVGWKQYFTTNPCSQAELDAANPTKTFTTSSTGDWNNLDTWGQDWTVVQYLNGYPATPVSFIGDIAVSPDGRIFFTDYSQKRIKYIGSDWNGALFGSPLVAYPSGINIDSDGKVYLSSNATGGGTITIFNPDGAVSQIYNNMSPLSPSILSGVREIVAASSGKMWVVDGSNQRIVALNSDGTVNSSVSNISPISPSTFKEPYGLKISKNGSGELYVTDMNNFRVVVLNANLIASTSYALGSGSYPSGFDISSKDGKLYVAEQRMNDLHKVAILYPNGTIQKYLTGFLYPHALALSSDGEKLFVSNSNGTNIKYLSAAEGYGYPAKKDDAILKTGTVKLNKNQEINNMTLDCGILDLNGFNLNVYGTWTNLCGSWVLNGGQVHLIGSEPIVTADNVLKKISGMQPGMEYKINSGDWAVYDVNTFDAVDFSGYKTVQIRWKETVQKPAGEITTLLFSVTNLDIPQNVIGTTYATLYGLISSDDAGDLTEIGFYYAAHGEELTNKVTKNLNLEPGIFSLTIYNLQCATTYDYKAYAANEAGEGYGDVVTFNTLDCPVIAPTSSPQVEGPGPLSIDDTTPTTNSPHHGGGSNTTQTNTDTDLTQVKDETTFIDQVVTVITNPFDTIKNLTETTIGAADQTIQTVSDAVVGIIPGGEAIQEIVSIPEVQTATKVLSVASLAVATYSPISAIGFAQTLPEMVTIPTRIIALIAGLFGLRRKKPWGIVYDSVTKIPIDGAKVTLFDSKTGQEIATSTSDMNGKYSFMIIPGEYKIRAERINYDFPSKKLSGYDHDELYENIYSDLEVIVVEGNTPVTNNIPLDPKYLNVDDIENSKVSVERFVKIRNTWARISKISFTFGAIFSLLVTIFAPRPYNYIIILFYILSYIANKIFIARKRRGNITDEENRPLPFAIVKIFAEGTHTVPVAKTVTDKYGRYYSLVPNGSYFIEIDSKNGDDYKPIYESKVFDAYKGYINRDIKA